MLRVSSKIYFGDHKKYSSRRNITDKIKDIGLLRICETMAMREIYCQRCDKCEGNYEYRKKMFL